MEEKFSVLNWSRMFTLFEYSLEAERKLDVHETFRSCLLNILCTFNLRLTTQKMMFSIKDLNSNCERIQFPANLVTFTDEILNRKLHFLCSVLYPGGKRFQQLSLLL